MITTSDGRSRKIETEIFIDRGNLIPKYKDYPLKFEFPKVNGYLN